MYIYYYYLLNFIYMLFLFYIEYLKYFFLNGEKKLIMMYFIKVVWGICC